MGQLTLWTYFLLIALSVAPMQRVMGCSCLLSHPQTVFCRSDYVAVVKVKWAKNVNDYEIAYNVRVNKVFKWNVVNPDDYPNQNVLWSAATPEMCGVRLNVGETYIVTGRIIADQVRLSLCGIAKRWSEVSSRQRKGFRGLYHHNCACEIDFTAWWRKGEALESSGRKRCLWESTPGPQDCQEKYGVCMAGPGECSWMPSVPYKKCIKEYQRKREQQRLREP